MNYNLCILKYAVLVLSCVAMVILTTAKNTCARSYFNMETPKLGLGFIYEFDNEKQTGPDINFQSESQEFRERLSVESNGWIYHPAFCEYDFDVRPEWRQRTEENDIQKGSKNGLLEGYLLRATFLPYKPYSLTLFGEKRNIPSLSAFSAVTDTDIEIFGGTLNFKNPVLPTSLSYVQKKEDETGYFDSQEKSDSWRLRSNYRKKNNDTQLNAVYEETMRTSGGFTSNVDTLNSSINNNYFLEDRRINFRTYLSQNLNDSNSSKTSSSLFQENIDWDHRENLSTNYYLSYGRLTSGDIFSGDVFNENKNIGAGLTHLLYENLTTKVSGNILKKEFTGGSQNSYNGDLQFNYRRPIPYGTLGANMGFNYKLRNSIFTEDFIPVIDEPHILTGFDFLFLDNKFIDIGSIKVTDITGIKLYIKNFDYEIDEINFFVRIRRLIGGSIVDGEQVLVSYNYLATTPSYDDSTLVQRYGFNLDLWSMLRFFYAYEHSKQNILSGIPPDEPEDDTRHTAELELLWRFTDTIFSYEKADRTAGNSTEIWSVNEVLTFRALTTLFFNFTGTFSHIELKDIDEKQDSYGLGFNIEWIPVSWGRFGFSGSHYIVSGDSINTDETAIKARFEMFYKIWKGSLYYTYNIYKDNDVNETRESNNIIFEIIKVNF